MEITEYNKLKAKDLLEKRNAKINEQETYKSAAGKIDRTLGTDFIIVKDQSGVDKKYSLTKYGDIQKLENDIKEGSIKLNIEDAKNLKQAKEKAIKDMGYGNFDEADNMGIGQHKGKSNINESKIDKALDKAYTKVDEAVDTTKDVTKTSKLKGIVELANKIPGVKKVLPVAKLAGKAAGPVGAALAIGDGLMDTRWEELSNEDKSRAGRLANFINDLTGKTIINAVGATAEGIPTAIGWAGGQVIDIFNEAFGDKAAREKDYSQEAVKAWDNSLFKNWMSDSRAKMLAFQDKMIYGKDKDNLKEYRSELGLDEKGMKKKEEPSDIEGIGLADESKVEKQVVVPNRQPDNVGVQPLTYQDRKLVKDPTTGKWGYKSKRTGDVEGSYDNEQLAKQAIDEGIKGFYKAGLKQANTTGDKVGAEDLTKRAKKRNITADEINAWLSE